MTSPTWTQWLIAHDRTSLSDKIRATIARHGMFATWLVPCIYAGCLAAFITDLLSADTMAFGVFYIPLVATAVFHRDRRAVWVLAGIACTMVVIGMFVPYIAPDVKGLIWNRFLSICAVLATAIFVWHARKIQDRLAEETDRAEAAERIKTEVLTNLSQEIRGPLYSMIGVLELVTSGSRPDQRAALGMVRGSGRRLVATVDNLVDLTQFAGQPLPAEALDLGQLLRQTAEARRQDAAVRQIAMTIDIPPVGGPSVVGGSHGHIPNGGIASGGVPSGGIPSGGIPSGGVPSGGVPSGGIPTGHIPSGHIPSGHIPSGHIPSGYIPSGCPALVSANPWAVRRILENKISDGITYTAPGGRIDVSIANENGQVAAVIVTSGHWPSGALLAAGDADAVPLTPSVMGLALSQRLARAMDARLTFSNGPGEGTTVRLILPAAVPDE